jgi:hypothetical protein
LLAVVMDFCSDPPMQYRSGVDTLGKASSSFPMLVVEEEAWSGDRMTFRVRALGQVAAGTADVADDHVQLEVTLPWLLHKFAQVVQQTIAGRGRILLEKK